MADPKDPKDVLEDNDSEKIAIEPVKKVKASKKKTPPTEEELQSPRTQEQFRLALRRKTKMYYDIQEMRLVAQGRLTKKAPGATIDLHPRDLVKLGARCQDLEIAEANALIDLTEHLHEVPFYSQVIAPQRKIKYRGLGPRMASVIVSSFDIHRSDTVSKMWAFAGLRPVPCRRCKKCSVVVVANEAENGPLPYKHPKPVGCKCVWAGGAVGDEDTFPSGKQQRPVAGEKLNYNAWLRTKLCGVLGEVLIKVGSPYRKFYDDYKHRKTSAGWGVSDMHRHKAAVRYMIKMLLLDIHKEWREFEGLPVRPPYSEEYLGHKHSGGTPALATIGAAFDPVAAEVEDEIESLSEELDETGEE